MLAAYPCSAGAGSLLGIVFLLFCLFGSVFVVVVIFFFVILWRNSAFGLDTAASRRDDGED